MKVITHKIKVHLSNTSLFLDINKKDYSRLLTQLPRGREKLVFYKKQMGTITEDIILINWDSIECIEFFTYLGDLELEV